MHIFNSFLFPSFQVRHQSMGEILPIISTYLIIGDPIKNLLEYNSNSNNNNTTTSTTAATFCYKLRNYKISSCGTFLFLLLLREKNVMPENYRLFFSIGGEVFTPINLALFPPPKSNPLRCRYRVAQKKRTPRGSGVFPDFWLFTN